MKEQSIDKIYVAFVRARGGRRVRHHEIVSGKLGETVGGVRAEFAVIENEHSTFEIPVAGFDWAMPVVADTTAMSEPHEIEYTLRFDSASIAPAAK